MPNLSSICPNCREPFTINDPAAVTECPYCACGMAIIHTETGGFVLLPVPDEMGQPAVLGVSVNDGVKSGEELG
jgi:hypothetical protein